MKQNKGFTLIELLAVIVILAIIALIATPIVLNMIANARKSAAKSSTLGYVDSIEYYAGFHQADPNGTDLGIAGYNVAVPAGDCNVTTTGDSVCGRFVAAVNAKSKGEAPKAGWFTTNNSGEVQAADLQYNGYTCHYVKGQDTTCDKADITAKVDTTTLAS